MRESRWQIEPTVHDLPCSQRLHRQFCVESECPCQCLAIQKFNEPPNFSRQGFKSQQSSLWTKAKSTYLESENRSISQKPRIDHYLGQPPHHHKGQVATDLDECKRSFKSFCGSCPKLILLPTCCRYRSLLRFTSEHDYYPRAYVLHCTPQFHQLV